MTSVTMTTLGMAIKSGYRHRHAGQMMVAPGDTTTLFIRPICGTGGIVYGTADPQGLANSFREWTPDIGGACPRCVKRYNNMLKKGEYTPRG